MNGSESGAAEQNVSPGDALQPDAIRLDGIAADRMDAVEQCGRLLVEVGAVAPGYIGSMLDRERSVSTFVGEGVALPHGTRAGKDQVHRSALVLIRFPDGVDWNGSDVYVCIGIAAPAGRHVALVARLAGILLNPERAAALRSANTPGQVRRLFDAEPNPRPA